MNQGKVLFPVCKGVLYIRKALNAVSSFGVAVDIVEKEFLIEKDFHNVVVCYKCTTFGKTEIMFNAFKHGVHEEGTQTTEELLIVAPCSPFILRVLSG
jgi:hypothetical protein